MLSGTKRTISVSVWNRGVLSGKAHTGGLAGNSTISSHDLNRDVPSRALDAVAEYGPERLFLKCAKAVSSKLGIKPDTVHLDSTSFHYEGRTRIEEGCILF